MRAPCTVSSCNAPVRRHWPRSSAPRGPCHWNTWARFGEELLEAVRYLADQGVSHRDIKPENLGIGFVPGGGKVRLMLFDFACTNPHRKRPGRNSQLPGPILEGRRAQKCWDLYAERYATAVTLYEMASGKHPVWSTDGSDPLLLAHEVTIEAELFEPVVREPLTAFFRQALRRDHRQRYDNAEDMLRAWRGVFEGIDRPAARTQDQPLSTDKIALKTPLTALGLSPSALSAVDRLGAVTVADLLEIPSGALNASRALRFASRSASTIARSPAVSSRQTKVARPRRVPMH